MFCYNVITFSFTHKNTRMCVYVMAQRVSAFRSTIEEALIVKVKIKTYPWAKNFYLLDLGD